MSDVYLTDDQSDAPLPVPPLVIPEAEREALAKAASENPALANGDANE